MTEEQAAQLLESSYWASYYAHESFFLQQEAFSMLGGFLLALVFCFAFDRVLPK